MDISFTLVGVFKALKLRRPIEKHMKTNITDASKTLWDSHFVSSLRLFIVHFFMRAAFVHTHTHSHTSKIHHHKQQHLPLPHYHHERTLSETNVFDLSPMHGVRSRALNCCCSATMLAAFTRTLNSIVYEQYDYISFGVRVRSAFDVYVCVFAFWVISKNFCIFDGDNDGCFTHKKRAYVENCSAYVYQCVEITKKLW